MKVLRSLKKELNNHKSFYLNEEMSDRRAKGLCYYCDEKYTPGHYLKYKKTQLYMLETENEEFFEAGDGSKQKEEEGDIAHISVSGVAGITENYRTMKVHRVHGRIYSIFSLILAQHIISWILQWQRS